MWLGVAAAAALAVAAPAERQFSVDWRVSGHPSFSRSDEFFTGFLLLKLLLPAATKVCNIFSGAI